MTQTLKEKSAVGNVLAKTLLIKIGLISSFAALEDEFSESFALVKPQEVLY